MNLVYKISLLFAALFLSTNAVSAWRDTPYFTMLELYLYVIITCLIFTIFVLITRFLLEKKIPGSVNNNFHLQHIFDAFLDFAHHRVLWRELS